MKTLVIGLDAASWRIIERLAGENELPNIERLSQDGTMGPLESTTPPMTPLAWTSAATGVNPGKHGIYDFIEQDPETYELSTVDYSTMNSPALWDVLDAEGAKGGFLNFPLAFPPPTTAEFFVSGIPATTDEQIASPTELNNRLERRDYRIHPEYGIEDGSKTYYDDICQLTDRQCSIATDLLSENDLDLFWTVFMGIDWVQHFLWDETIDGERAVEKFYKHMDGVVGRLVDATEGDWNVVILSDHGAQGLDSVVHLNDVLEDWGYIEREKPDRSGIFRITDTVLDRLWSLGRRLPTPLKRRLKRRTPEGVQDSMRRAAGVDQMNMHESIRWSETRAFSFGTMGRIYVHSQERYPDGTVPPTDYEDVVAELTERLNGLRHPKTGAPLIQNVSHGNDLYTGENTERGADIVATPVNWQYMLHGNFGPSWIHQPGRRAADHDNEGFALLSGEPFSGGSLTADIIDITPTLLYLHDLPISDEMEGEVLMDTFADDFSRDHEITTVPNYSFSKNMNGRQSRDKEIEERLEDLGYL